MRALDSKEYSYIELPILAAEIAVDLDRMGLLKEGQKVEEVLLEILADLRENAGDEPTYVFEERK
jgi:hypothetical protein